MLQSWRSCHRNNMEVNIKEKQKVKTKSDSSLKPKLNMGLDAIAPLACRYAKDVIASKVDILNVWQTYLRMASVYTVYAILR